MKKLFNEEDRRILTKRIEESNQPRRTLSFYAYAHLPNPQIVRDHLFIEWSKLSVLGRTYIAKEGINAQISVPQENLNALRLQLNTISFLNEIRLNIAVEETAFSFIKLKIKVRDKIVADGLNDATFDVTDRGIHLSAKAFNMLTEKNDTILIDMRNHYESEVGKFKGAITPDVDTFRDSLPIIEEQLKGKENENIVMYCTGGIRCEKASAWFKHKGFKNVHQLEGGIIEYARQAKENGLENKFVGKNFVFDDRRGERISEDIIAQCHQCGQPCDNHVNCANEACHLLFIQCNNCKNKYENTCSENCQKIIHLPDAEQKLLRKGIEKGNLIFKKGRSEHLKL
jgi:UPF0176 protein